MRRLRVLFGATVWIVAVAFSVFWFRDYLQDPGAEGRRVTTDLWRFATAERRVIRFRLEGNWTLAVGDPIYRIDGPQQIEQVGEIRRIDWDTGREKQTAVGPIAEALLYPNAPSVNEVTSLTYYTTPRSMTWVMETMLPREKRLKVAREILLAYESYHTEIFAALKPVVVGGFTDAMQVVEEDLAAALQRHREDLERLGSRYQSRIVEQEILPLVREEIWPIVQQHAEPVANQIGEELFERASVWRFGWRLLYDKSFLPKKNLTQEEWNRFVREEGIPVLEQHRDDIIAVQRKVLEDIANNQKVRSAVRRNMTRLIDDPELRSIVWQIFREVLVDNERLRKRLEERWKTTEAQRAVALAANYVEPCVRRIGDILFGTRQDGIAPEFAQVLRNQILDKDCRWLVINSMPSDTANTQSAQGSSTKAKKGGSRSDLFLAHWGGYPDVNPFAVELRGVK